MLLNKQNTYPYNNRQVSGLLTNNTSNTIIKAYTKIPLNWNARKHMLYKYLIVQLIAVVYLGAVLVKNYES
jgi:hypothetical protein